LFTKACLPYMKNDGQGNDDQSPPKSIGVTGATASWRGMPYTPAFASSKMATRGLTQALARDLGPKDNIHVFHVVIDGIVNLGEATKQSFPDKPQHEMLDPVKIADTYYMLARQPNTCWTQEIHVGAGGAYASIASI
jgi:NAD(P)-dependent dehydrogenase (short-subunit alcohol dehydrogenase family)